MIEVVTAPAHLAGAVVVSARTDDAFEPSMTVLTLDHRHPNWPSSFAVHAEDVQTVGMLPADHAAFREALGRCPEPSDVVRALRSIPHQPWSARPAPTPKPATVDVRAVFLSNLDRFARRIAAMAPRAHVGMTASANDGDWCIYFNGPPLFLGHTPADLAAADRDLGGFADIRAVLLDGPHFYTNGARVRPVAVAGGPVADA